MENVEIQRLKVLKLDVSGRPLKWLSWQEAVVLYCQNKVAWDTGGEKIVIRGGINRRSGRRSTVAVSSIVAVKGRSQHAVREHTPPLSNRELFRRDQYLCLYCGEEYRPHELTRDHVVPVSQQGPDSWTNVVTACKQCNQKKGGRRPEQAGMRLLAVPFVPSHAEYLILSNRKILADQMAFLHRHVPKDRRGVC